MQEATPSCAMRALQHTVEPEGKHTTTLACRISLNQHSGAIVAIFAPAPAAMPAVPAPIIPFAPAPGAPAHAAIWASRSVWCAASSCNGLPFCLHSW